MISGSSTNVALLSLFDAHLSAITAALKEADYVELGVEALVMHHPRPEGPPE